MTRILIVTMIILAGLGAALGHWAGGFFARQNLTVRLAERIAFEETTGTEERTLESEAFRGTGTSPEKLYADAGRIVKRFRLGSAILGAFCGMAMGMRLLGQSRAQRSDTYSIDRDECVSCARCFMSCPRERLRCAMKPPQGSSSSSNEMRSPARD